MTPTQARVLERTAISPSAGELGAVHDPGHSLLQGLGELPGRDLAAATLAVIRREWVATLFVLSAIFAVITALVSFNAPERLWGELAVVSYTISAVIAVAARRRGATPAALVGLAGALLAPLAWMAATGLAQPEVHVIIRSAQMLVHTGTPYSSPAALAAAHSWLAYDPYLPALIAFGMPRALAGGLRSGSRTCGVPPGGPCLSPRLRWSRCRSPSAGTTCPFWGWCALAWRWPAGPYRASGAGRWLPGWRSAWPRP